MLSEKCTNFTTISDISLDITSSKLGDDGIFSLEVCLGKGAFELS
jgi:hypothetical protein